MLKLLVSDHAGGYYVFLEVNAMISKLMNQESPCGEPEYSKISTQMEELQQKLRELLPPESQNLLERLTSASVRRENVLAEDEFVEGFCTAAAMALELYKRTNSSQN